MILDPSIQLLSSLRDRDQFRTVSALEPKLDFSSNDYLGLSNDAVIRRKLIAALEEGCPLGSTGSNLVSGYTQIHEATERFLQSHFQVPSALLFSSGFLANIGALGALGRINVEFFCDENNHASLIDGVRTTGRPKQIFRHNDMDHLEQLLKSSGTHLRVIVTESLFSMDGDRCLLAHIITLAKRFEALVVLDEAHDTGIIYEHRNPYDGLLSVHTASKALGGQGAFVLSNRAFRDLIINTARSYIYTTSLAPLCAFQIQCALEFLVEHPERGQQLRSNIQVMRESLPEHVIPDSPIVPILVDGAKRALELEQRLSAQGFAVRAIRSPTVREGKERVRLTIKSFHKIQDLQRLAEILQKRQI